MYIEFLIVLPPLNDTLLISVFPLLFLTHAAYPVSMGNIYL